MSNTLIIKHGSLGDIVQISGVLKDIRESSFEEKIFILTTSPYAEILSRCPYIDGVLIDKRLPRWNIIYLAKLKKMIKKYNFTKVVDLQNSSRTSFYRKFLFNISEWSSSETVLNNKDIKREAYDQVSVLERFKIQLDNSNIDSRYTMKPDFSWACTNVESILNKYTGKNFILIFPFSSPKLTHKQWPYFNELIKIIKSKHNNFEILIAPGPNELDLSKEIDAIVVMNQKRALNISELAGLIKKSSFVVSNDTGPAHMAAHLNSKGLVLFGHHTTPKKVSIETKNFKALQVDNLDKLAADFVYSKIKEDLLLIN